MKKFLNKITNGILLIVIGILHTQLVVSADGYENNLQNLLELVFLGYVVG